MKIRLSNSSKRFFCNIPISSDPQQFLPFTDLFVVTNFQELAFISQPQQYILLPSIL
jgi:hypothetical protein